MEVILCIIFSLVGGVIGNLMAGRTPQPQVTSEAVKTMRQMISDEHKRQEEWYEFRLHYEVDEIRERLEKVEGNR